MKKKWSSRKFIVAIVAAVYSVAASAGWDVPIAQIVVVDAVLGLYILVEGVVDSCR